MKLHNLKPAEGSVHKQKRLGRGEASGKGGTSTKGNKGSQSRAGYQRKKCTRRWSDAHSEKITQTRL